MANGSKFRLTERAIREFAQLECAVLDAAGLGQAELRLGMVVGTAHFVRRQDNGLELWRCAGTTEERGRPRYRLLVGDGAVVRVLGESSRGRRGR